VVGCRSIDGCDFRERLRVEGWQSGVRVRQSGAIPSGVRREFFGENFPRVERDRRDVEGLES